MFISLLGVKMQSYLYKKSDKNKKWKSLYFVLVCFDGNAAGGGGDTHLYFYENPKVSFQLFFSKIVIFEIFCKNY